MVVLLGWPLPWPVIHAWSTWRISHSTWQGCSNPWVLLGPGLPPALKPGWFLRLRGLLAFSCLPSQTCSQKDSFKNLEFFWHPWVGVPSSKTWQLSVSLCFCPFCTSLKPSPPAHSNILTYSLSWKASFSGLCFLSVLSHVQIILEDRRAPAIITSPPEGQATSTWEAGLGWLLAEIPGMCAPLLSLCWLSHLKETQILALPLELRARQKCHLQGPWGPCAHRVIADTSDHEWSDVALV